MRKLRTGTIIGPSLELAGVWERIIWLCRGYVPNLSIWVDWDEMWK